ncbi:MAG: hypothetical protein EZS28_001906 [Streblomastix strix]|uniref:Uncharacterized protein n=1 Tax=Streblomastix strix TaxID=222440 RepID=A0A5J4X764_9EUKA|nr:MAG: hypothetical protein EZS28_001906 [Streblomastix strix]
MDRMHYVCGDTDSMTQAIRGNPDEDCRQKFKQIIKDQQFFNENYSLFFGQQKQLLGVRYEAEGTAYITQTASLCALIPIRSTNIAEHTAELAQMTMDQITTNSKFIMNADKLSLQEFSPETKAPNVEVLQLTLAKVEISDREFEKPVDRFTDPNKRDEQENLHSCSNLYTLNFQLYMQPPKVGYDSFEIMDELEGGAQGRKYFVKLIETGVPYAMKSVKYVLYIPFKIAQTCTWLWNTARMGTFSK